VSGFHGLKHVFPGCEYNGQVEFALRDYRPQDFETLWIIDQECFAPGIAYSRRELGAYIRRAASFTIVAQGEFPDLSPRTPAPAQPFASIGGFIVAEVSARRVGHIISIDVLPEFRRSGLGSRLLLAAEERLYKFRCETSMLETAVDNAAALAFYKRHLYAIVKVIPHYYSSGVDALVLEKRIGSGQEAKTASG
jgi:[ribosomal protein S18]-alanine N-acetyltransferase